MRSLWWNGLKGEPGTYAQSRHFSVTSEKERLHGTSGSTHIVNKSTFYHQEIKLGQNGQGVGSLKSGNHEFPFEFIVPGDISETVEGLPQNFIIYELKAVIERGIMAKDVVATRRLRFIRTLAEDSTELMDPQVCKENPISPLARFGDPSRYTHAKFTFSIFAQFADPSHDDRSWMARGQTR